MVGSFGALVTFLLRRATHAVSRDTLVAAFRSNLGRSILLGLEFLVAADIIKRAKHWLNASLLSDAE